MPCPALEMMPLFSITAFAEVIVTPASAGRSAPS